MPPRTDGVRGAAVRGEMDLRGGVRRQVHVEAERAVASRPPRGHHTVRRAVAALAWVRPPTGRGSITSSRKPAFPRACRMPTTPLWNHSSIWSRIMWFLELPMPDSSGTVVRPWGLAVVGAMEGAGEQGQRLVGGAARAFDPAALTPVGALEEPHLPRGGPTPRCRLVVGVPRPHLPDHPVPGGSGGTVPHDVVSGPGNPPCRCPTADDPGRGPTPYAPRESGRRTASIPHAHRRPAGQVAGRGRRGRAVRPPGRRR